MKSDFRAADDERVDMRLTRRVVHKLAWVLGGIGVFGSLLGVIIGFATADHAVPIPCGPGQGQLDACYSHPQLGVGSAIGFISLAVGALVLLGSISVNILGRQMPVEP